MTGKASELEGAQGHQRGDTYSRASSTSGARGARLTTNTLGTFRASGSLGTSFALDQKEGDVRSYCWSPTSPLDGGGMEGRDRRPESGLQDQGEPRTKVLRLLSCHSGSLWFGSRETSTPWPMGTLLRGRGSHLSTNSTRESRRTSGASGTL